MGTVKTTMSGIPNRHRKNEWRVAGAVVGFLGVFLVGVSFLRDMVLGVYGAARAYCAVSR